MTMSLSEIIIISYASYKGEERPSAIIINNEKFSVEQILDRWVEEDFATRDRRRYFIVRVDDGLAHKLYYDEKKENWIYAGNIVK